MKADDIRSEIDSILAQIVDKYRPLKVILFGSAAKGEFDEVNDLIF
ncbi:MAG: hypothetical protein JW883_09265 [Deltaproteobacteria bacterium]|nr:hypothetical protein [Deltaproteobacteria bacterium]